MLRYALSVRRLWDGNSGPAFDLPYYHEGTVFCDLEECEIPSPDPKSDFVFSVWKVTAYFEKETIVGYQAKFLGYPARIVDEDRLYDGRFNMSNNAQ